METTVFNLSRHIRTLQSNYYAKYGFPGIHRYTRRALRKLFAVLATASEDKVLSFLNQRSFSHTDVPLDSAQEFVFDRDTFMHIFWAETIVNNGYDELTKLVLALHQSVPEFITHADIDISVFDDLAALASAETICIYVELFSGKLGPSLMCIIRRLCNRIKPSQSSLSLDDINQILAKISSYGYVFQCHWFDKLIPKLDADSIGQMFSLFAHYKHSTDLTNSMLTTIAKEKRYILKEKISLCHKALQCGIKPDIDCIIEILFKCENALEIISVIMTYHRSIMKIIDRCEFILRQILSLLEACQTYLPSPAYLKHILHPIFLFQPAHLFLERLPSIFPDIYNGVCHTWIDIDKPVVRCYGSYHDKIMMKLLHTIFPYPFSYVEVDNNKKIHSICSELISRCASD